MEESIKVAISSDFLSAFATLPRQIQKKVTEFINKFKTNPKSSGINLEKIKDGKDKNLCSVRIDDTYRGILIRQEKSNVYLLLWVDHHDEAYEWARRKRCEVNKITGTIQVFDVLEVIEESNDTQPGIFDEVKKKDLLTLGVPECLCDYLRTLKTADSFYKNIQTFPRDAIEPLSWIVEGIDVSEVIEAYVEDNDIDVVSEDLATALSKSTNMQSFVVIEGEDELRKIMSAPLEKWRIFLHPTQRKIVKKNYSGPARILGGAGTDRKSVV